MTEPELRRVTLWVCDLCLGGAGGECHSPGCAFFICPAPDAEQAARLAFGVEQSPSVPQPVGMNAPNGEPLLALGCNCDRDTGERHPWFDCPVHRSASPVVLPAKSDDSR